jgi:hypothetical protein
MNAAYKGMWGWRYNSTDFLPRSWMMVSDQHQVPANVPSKEARSFIIISSIIIIIIVFIIIIIVMKRRCISFIKDGKYVSELSDYKLVEKTSSP